MSERARHSEELGSNLALKKEKEKIMNVFAVLRAKFTHRHTHTHKQTESSSEIRSGSNSTRLWHTS